MRDADSAGRGTFPVGGRRIRLHEAGTQKSCCTQVNLYHARYFAYFFILCLADMAR